MDTEDGPAPDGPTQAQVIAALLASRNLPPAPPSRTYASYTLEELRDEAGRNKIRLRCLREGCGSLILLEGVGELRESGDDSWRDLDAGRDEPHPVLPPMTREQKWWRVTPSPMAFENVAFSKAVPADPSALATSSPAQGEEAEKSVSAAAGTEADNPATEGRKTKYLGCAECELGPIGWCWDGKTNEYWVNVERVGYRS